MGLMLERSTCETLKRRELSQQESCLTNGRKIYARRAGGGGVRSAGGVQCPRRAEELGVGHPRGAGQTRQRPAQGGAAAPDKHRPLKRP